MRAGRAKGQRCNPQPVRIGGTRAFIDHQSAEDKEHQGRDRCLLRIVYRERVRDAYCLRIQIHLKELCHDQQTTQTNLARDLHT